MFGAKVKTPTPVADPEPVPQRPLPVEIRAETYSLDEYEAICCELSVKSAKLLEAKVLQFMAGAGMQTYPLDQVSAYLRKLASVGSYYWCWSPLREQDVQFVGYYHSHSHVNPSFHGDRVSQLYSHAVPLAELRKVKLINEKFNAGEVRVGFFVSDYRVPNPDPFIMLVGDGFGPIVFGVWDEPGFGIK